MNRRHFIQSGSLMGVGALLWPRNGPPRSGGETARSRVVLARCSAAPRNPAAQTIAEALDRGLTALLGMPALQAWQSLFSPRDVVGLKVNCLAGRGISTHPALTEAIIQKLQLIGVTPDRIIVWDRLNADLQRGGFGITQHAGRVRCYGNDVSGYSSRLYEIGAICSRLSRIVTEQCTALINVPVLKDHGIVGISAAMKNYFGAIDNPNKYHDHIGDPYVADVCRLPLLRDKTRLTICDGLSAQYEGGPPYMPQWCWPLQQLILATDMVALDSTAWRIIEEKRRELHLPSLKEAGREPSYIITAAQQGSGIADESRIEIMNV